MKTGIFAITAFCATVAFAQGPGAFVRPGGPGRGFGAERVVTGAPYSAVEVHQFQEQLADGNTINRTSQITLYRDTNGRTRTEVTVTPPSGSGKQPFTMVTISDHVAGKQYILDSSTMTFHTNRIPVANAVAGNRSGRGGNAQARTAPSTSGSATPAVRQGRGGAQITRAALGSQMKNGALATGTRETEVIAAGKVGNAQPLTVTRETWYSEQLKRNVEVRVVDPQHGDSTTELTNLVAAEPSAALFEVPSGYTEKNVRRGGGPGFARSSRPVGPGSRQ